MSALNVALKGTENESALEIQTNNFPFLLKVNFMAVLDYGIKSVYSA